MKKLRTPIKNDLSFYTWAFAIITALISVSALSASGQTTIIDTSINHGEATVIAGKQYKRSGLHDIFWGKHYRKEWATPVKVKSIMLDTAFGGLKPIEMGGGRQTKTLRLEDKNGKQYVLRSIDKTYTKALPEIFQGTFVESIANDEVSVAHPYSTVTVPTLATAAKVYHTNPQIVFLPNQETLGKYSSQFANQLYLIEERPSGFEGNAENFGNSENSESKISQKIFPF